MYKTEVYGLNTDKSYFRYVRNEIAEYVVQGGNRVLDVGCGAGYFGEYLKASGRAVEIVGIEYDPLAASEASTKLDHLICENMNQSSVHDILKGFNKASFDYIVCADILEHLINPWKVLNELVAYLKPNGRCILSLPNARHWSVWLPLILRGRWDYKDSGIMDRTHLRYFTKASVLDMIAAAQLEVIENRPLIGGKSIMVDKYSLRLLRDMVTIQWVFVCGVTK